MKNFIVRRIVSAAIVIVVAGVCSGCLAGGAVSAVTTIAPMVAAGSAQLVGSQVAMNDKSGGTSAEENPDKCDQLLRAPVGVEEVRKNKSGEIESRQWKIAQTSGEPIWIVAQSESEDSPKNAWQAKPGITNLLFNPPLNEVLEPDKPEYLAYAPADVVNVSDSEQFDSMTGAFGAGIGTFKWRERSYSFVLVKALPCFKPAKEK